MKHGLFLHLVRKKIIIFSILVVISCLVGVFDSFAKTLNSDDLLCTYFCDNNSGWAAGRWGTLLKTDDGGNTWNIVPTPTKKTLTGIYFFDQKMGWIVGEAGTIFKTEDGGKSWHPQMSPVPFYLMDVFFVSEKQGWIVTERTHILSTDNGGETWKISFKDEDLILKSIVFSDSLHGWTVGEYGYIYHTENSGKTWVKQAGFVGFDEEKMEIVGDPFLFDVEAIDNLNVWAVGIDGQIIHSIDGGDSWTSNDIGTPKVQLFCVSSNKKTTITIGGKRVFYVSTDKGEDMDNTKI